MSTPLSTVTKRLQQGTTLLIPRALARNSVDTINQSPVAAVASFKCLCLCYPIESAVFSALVPSQIVRQGYESPAMHLLRSFTLNCLEIHRPYTSSSLPYLTIGLRVSPSIGRDVDNNFGHFRTPHSSPSASNRVTITTRAP